MKVIILGKGQMFANLIEGVLESGSEIVGVFRHETTSESRFKLFLKDFFQSSPEYTLIKSHKLHEIKCKSANSKEFKDEVLKLNPDIILVGTWRERLKKETINLPSIATINVHPSLLPKYRGPNPYLQTILHGEAKSGITFHLMDENYDTGAVLMQKEIEILPSYTSKELRGKTVFYARAMVQELMKSFSDGFIQPVMQNEKEASYFANISGDERMLNFELQTSDEIIRTVRALHPFLPTYITIGNRFLVVNPYEIRHVDLTGNAGQIISKNPDAKSLTIACKDGKCVEFCGLKLYKLPFFTKMFIKNL